MRHKMLQFIAVSDCMQNAELITTSSHNILVLTCCHRFVHDKSLDICNGTKMTSASVLKKTGNYAVTPQSGKELR